jgi:uncharacterized damage-inducible protein DinB
MSQDHELAAGVKACFRKHMLDEFVPRIRQATALLTDVQAWQKPSKHGNSVANLIVHLSGNTRQWILCGIAGKSDHRDRAGEFAATAENESRSIGELLDQLETTVTEACDIVAAMSVDEFLSERDFQGGRYRGTGLSGVLHVLEHFSGHAGQIYAQSKQLSDADLGFFAHLATDPTGKS